MGKVRELERDEAAVSQAWVKAGEKLGVDAVCPFELSFKGKTLTYPVYLPHFGNAQGTLLIAWNCPEREKAQQAAKASGYFYTILMTGRYATYEEERFIDTLNDWGWFGPKRDTPSWYTGK